MKMYNAIYPEYQALQEYLVILRDENIKCFCNEKDLRSIALKTNCEIVLTNRILNRKIGKYRIIKYAIVQIRGREESSIRRCNHLLELRFPFYRNRQEYQKKSNCCTIFQNEFVPDNSQLYYQYQRRGATNPNFEEVYVSSPYSYTSKRPKSQTYWKQNDKDLNKGILIPSSKQLEKYTAKLCGNNSSECYDRNYKYMGGIQKQMTRNKKVNLQSTIAGKKNVAFYKKYFQVSSFDLKHSSNTFHQQDPPKAPKRRSFSLQKSPKILLKQVFPSSPDSDESKQFVEFSIFNQLISEYETVKNDEIPHKSDTEITSHKKETNNIKKEGDLTILHKKAKSDETLSNLESLNKMVKIDVYDNLKLHREKEKQTNTELLSSFTEIGYDFSVNSDKLPTSQTEDQKSLNQFSLTSKYPNNSPGNMIFFHLKTSHAPENQVTNSNLQNQLINQNYSLQTSNINSKITRYYYKTSTNIRTKSNPMFIPELHLKPAAILRESAMTVETSRLRYQEVGSSVTPFNSVHYSTIYSSYNQLTEISNNYNNKPKFHSKIPIKISSAFNGSNFHKVEPSVIKPDDTFDIQNNPNLTEISENIFLNFNDQGNLETVKSDQSIINQAFSHLEDTEVTEVVNDYVFQRSSTEPSLLISVKNLLNVTETKEELTQRQYSVKKADLIVPENIQTTVVTTETVKDQIRTAEMTRSSEIFNNNTRESSFLDDKTDIVMSMKSYSDIETEYKMELANNEGAACTQFESNLIDFVEFYPSFNKTEIKCHKSKSLNTIGSQALDSKYSETFRFNQYIHEIQPKVPAESYKLNSKVSSISSSHLEKPVRRKFLKLEKDVKSETREFISNRKETEPDRVEQTQSQQRPDVFTCVEMNETHVDFVLVKTKYQDPLQKAVDLQLCLQSLENDITVCTKEAIIPSPKLDDNETVVGCNCDDKPRNKEFDTSKDHLLADLNLSLGDIADRIHQQIPYYMDRQRNARSHLRKDEVNKKLEVALKDIAGLDVSLETVKNEKLLLDLKTSLGEPETHPFLIKSCIDSDSDSSVTLFSLNFEVPFDNELDITHAHRDKVQMLPVNSNFSNNACDTSYKSSLFFSSSSTAKSLYNLDSAESRSHHYFNFCSQLTNDFSSASSPVLEHHAQIIRTTFNQHSHHFDIHIEKSNLLHHSPHHFFSRSPKFFCDLFWASCVVINPPRMTRQPFRFSTSNLRVSSHSLNSDSIDRFYLVHYKASLKIMKQPFYHTYLDVATQLISTHPRIIPTNNYEHTTSLTTTNNSEISLVTVSQTFHDKFSLLNTSTFLTRSEKVQEWVFRNHVTTDFLH